VLGWDRQLGQHPAGLRVHVLVALGAAVYTVAGVYGVAGLGTVHDAGRVAAQVVVGVGFLGAGTIWRSRDDRVIYGLTTAASIWLAAGLGLLAGSEEVLRAFVDDQRRRWVPAREYVLSHVDGIQALVIRTTGAAGAAGATGATGATGTDPCSRWELSGHVDLEDMAFMDARLPLAGCELECGGPERRRRVPPDFWAGYRRHKEVDPSYAATRNLFQLYYLLAWTRALYNADHRDPAAREREVQRYARAIVGLAVGQGASAASRRVDGSR
jgi:hypothetical protein